VKVDYCNSLCEIAKITGGELVGNGSVQISSICTDSRLCDNGSLFIPIRGEKFDGHEFIDSLCEQKGIACYLTENNVQENKVPYVLCDNTLYALAKIAGSYRNTFDLPVVGITGTNGKTTTKELIFTVLNGSYSVHRNIKNYNNEIGVPFTLLQFDNSHNAAVIEMGMNHVGEIFRLSAIVRPDTAVITNIGAGHLEFLGTTQNVARAKSEIFSSMNAGSTVFINRDTIHYDIVSEAALEKKLVVKSYGLHKESDITPDSYLLKEDSIVLNYKGVQITAPLYGVHNVMNTLAAIAVGEHMGVTLDLCAERLKGFKNESMRGHITEGRCRVINDAYNSNPLSLENALRSVGTIYSSSRTIAVLGDMKELGSKATDLHFECGAAVARYGFKRLYTLGKLASQIAEGAKENGMDRATIFSFENKEKLVEALLKDIKKDDVVLVKGSRSMKMEEVAEQLIR